MKQIKTIHETINNSIPTILLATTKWLQILVKKLM